MIKNWKVGFGLGVIFLSGMIIGIVGTTYYTRQQVNEIITSGAAGTAQLMSEHLSRELHLSQEQANKAAEAVRAFQQDMFALRRAHEDEIRLIIDKLTSRIAETLTAKQSVKFDKMADSFRSRIFGPPNPS